MENATLEKPYKMLVVLSKAAKAALKRERGRRMAAGDESTIVQIASEAIEKWAQTAP